MAAPRSAREPGDAPSEGLLTLDRGNTTLDCQLVGRRGIVRRRLPPDAAAELLELLGEQPAYAVGCSVVAGGLDAAAAALAARGVALAVAGRDLPCPLQLRYRDPGQLGVDRWVAATAAQRQWGDAVVVDCGTAVTVDAVSGDGVFLGGAIAPGAAAMAAGLAARAPALPRADLTAAAEVAALAGSSAEAVRAGVVLGFCGAVDRLVDAVLASAGLARPELLLTGGEAELYLRHGRHRVRHVPDLVHRGLAELWRAR